MEDPIKQAQDPSKLFAENNKGNLRQVLQKELSILFVIALGLILVWSGANHYYGSFQGGIAWLASSQKAIKNQKELDKKVLVDRILTLANIDNLNQLVKTNESFLKLQKQETKLKIVAQKGEVSKPLFEKLQDFIATYHQVDYINNQREVAVHFVNESHHIYLAALLTLDGYYYILLQKLDEAWLNHKIQLAGTEGILVTPTSEILHSTFKNSQGIRIFPRWTYNNNYREISIETETHPEYHQLQLSDAYLGAYGEFHVNEVEFYAFHTSIPLKNIHQQTIAWVWIILPENVMLFWPKIGILGLALIGLLTLVLILWRLRVITLNHWVPINELTLEIEKLNLAIGGLSTLQNHSQFHDINQLKQAVTQLKYQINLNKDLEDQLRQSQKMEVVGTLAGGVAHDFNNLLSVILLNSEFLQSDLQKLSHHSEDQASTQYIEWQDMTTEMILACEQAKILTQQLLSLSRDQSNQHTFFDICQSIEKSYQLLQRLVPESVSMYLHQNIKELWIKGNENALQQVIMNLALNAKDAITNTGHIYIEIFTHHQEQVEVLNGGALKPGDYACIKVQDTGHGISDEHMDQIFEPFFSLKGKKGTGLGLTVVYNTIVRRFKGGIKIESNLNQGSIFYLYVPAVKSRSSITNEGLRELNTPVYGQHLVLLEDHNLVRRSMTQILINLGFQVTSFATGIEFIQWIGKMDQEVIEEISLIVTDVVMPNMSGPEVWIQLKDQYPQLPFLFLTGYDNDILNQYNVPQELVLLKPASVDILYKRIVEIIGGSQVEVKRDQDLHTQWIEIEKELDKLNSPS